MKFVADYNLIPGSLELDRSSDITEIPLAQELFNYPFVERIFITANFIAVAKQDTVESVSYTHLDVYKRQELFHSLKVSFKSSQMNFRYFMLKIQDSKFKIQKILV